MLGKPVVIKEKSSLEFEGLVSRRERCGIWVNMTLNICKSEVLSTDT